MAKNRIQFQEGLSLPSFLRTYGSETQCREALQAWRWPSGFVCPRCGQPTRVGHKIREDGSKARACKKCGEPL